MREMMDEVAVISEKGMELEVKETEEGGSAMKEAASAAGVVRWEKFLPRMVLRVLLIEADDSTRQIISALLTKCSYKVTAVSDGLKAWEVLKEQPRKIDLILAEVELPSISGFALLTLIAEHEICKNIPVIMMSSLDSVSTVYKCMLSGAADFLVKPLRKNELRNLWQHVWRRQARTGGKRSPQDESDTLQKLEVTAENNATSNNHSSGYMACVNGDYIEKGSDAQSSCTKPHLGSEAAYIEHMEDLSQVKWSKSLSSDQKLQKQEGYVKSSMQVLMHDSEAGGSAVAASKNVDKITQGEDMGSESQWKCSNVITEDCDKNHVAFDSSREAIDLIGAFNNYLKCSYRGSVLNYDRSKVESSPLLDLSLRRSHPTCSVNQTTGEKHGLKHSDSSAFSWYVNKTPQPLHSTSATMCNQRKDHEANSDKGLNNHVLEYNSDTHGTAVNSQKDMFSPTADQPRQGENQFPCRQQILFPFPIPMRGTRCENLCTAYGSVLPPIDCTKSGLSPKQSPGSFGPQLSSFQVNPLFPSNPDTTNCPQTDHRMDQNANSAPDQTDHKIWHKLESLENRGHFSSTTEQSGSSSFCNGALSHVNSIGGGSNSNVGLIRVVSAVPQCGNESNHVHDGNSHRSVHREAALNKFRMKRKDRCYEKKVRYESRKKLAEQRPRVKGQFIRHVHSEAPPVETDSSMAATAHS